jgi:hypothetical protein
MTTPARRLAVSGATVSIVLDHPNNSSSRRRRVRREHRKSTRLDAAWPTMDHRKSLWVTRQMIAREEATPTQATEGISIPVLSRPELTMNRSTAMLMAFERIDS